LHKAKEKRNDLGICTCTVKTSMGIPCFHTIAERLTHPGHILPEDIHPFWWYKRPDAGTSSTIAIQVCPIVLNPAIVRGKGRPKGAKNKAKEKGHGVTGTRRDLSQFEHPSSSAPPILSRQPTESALVMSLLAVGNNTNDGEDEDEDEDGSNDALIDPILRAMSTTQLGQMRMETVFDTLLPGTLPPRLYQTNPFAHPAEPIEAGEILYQFSASEMPPTAEEIECIAEEEAEENGISQAIEELLATATRASRKRKPVGKVVDTTRQELEAKRSKRGGKK
jgi:hypothetical protein